ncbi:MAG TPA: gamma-glutamyltransferase, partial [Candidatus Acetothermia bacterium]|nr:gamma-glutamyltransferase [Candidatus Acetothermia bacterium]HEX32432.1 gamma-glutamyltransferase [Candidatus Acetothermia bacterium]
MVLATEGMVAASQPLAVQVGIDVLKRGGNAIDAAIAVNATLGVVEPMSCGLGGDLFAIVWDAKSERLYGLNGSGRSPYSLNRDVFVERDLDRIPLRGVLSW